MQIIPRERLERVEALYLAGVPEREIQRAVTAEFGVRWRQAYRYLERVKAKFAKMPAPDAAAVRARSEAMLLETYLMARERRGLAGPDLRTMALVADRLAVLHGAVAPARVELTGKDGAPLHVTLDWADGEPRGK